MEKSRRNEPIPSQGWLPGADRLSGPQLHATIVPYWMRSDIRRSLAEEIDSSSLPRPYKSLKDENQSIRSRIGANTFTEIPCVQFPLPDFLANPSFIGTATRKPKANSCYRRWAAVARSLNCSISVSFAAENNWPSCTLKSPPYGDSMAPPASWMISAPAATSQILVL